MVEVAQVNGDTFFYLTPYYIKKKLSPSAFS